MKKEDRVLLAKSYQASWYAFKGQEISVSVEDNGWFLIKFSEGSYGRKVRTSALLETLSRITDALAQKREAQGALTYTRV